MKKPIPWLFPIALAVGWVTTSGYVFSRLASLHATLAQQSAHWRPDVAFSSGVAVGTFSCDDPGRGPARVADLRESRNAASNKSRSNRTKRSRSSSKASRAGFKTSSK
jgi:hypothetical protein